MVTATAAITAALLSPPVAARAGGRDRWPRWPTEVDRIVAPLRAEDRDGDAARVEALVALDDYATPVLEPWLLQALGDPSSAVRREALRICFEREMTACVPSALAVWSAVSEPMLRVAALRVVALDPAGAGLDALLGGLRDESETMRAQAAAVLGSARLSGPTRVRAQAALLAKLGDLSALVRQHAVESLGLLGAADATMAIARLLDDAEPMVRLAAARALGQLGDGRAVAALVRSLRAVNEPAVVRAVVAALAVLPGDAAVDELLAVFDEPPAGLGAHDVADLLGLRPNPEARLLEGLARRLADPTGARVALRALAALGDAGAPVLERAQQRGVAPDLALEIGRVLAARRATPSSPRGRDEPVVLRAPGALDEALRGPVLDGLTRVPELLGRRAWGPWIDARLTQPGPLDEHRIELVIAAAIGADARLGRRDRRAVATLVGWAGDASRPRQDRCLALLALGGVDRRGRGLRMAAEAAARALADADALVRACAVPTWRALARRPDARALLDGDPRVRTAAVLAARHRPTRSERAALAWMVVGDPDAHVRAAARLPRHEGAPTAIAWHHGGARDQGLWMRVRHGEARVWLPTVTVAGLVLGWAPDLAGAEPDPEG